MNIYLCNRYVHLCDAKKEYCLEEILLQQEKLSYHC